MVGSKNEVRQSSTVYSSSWGTEYDSQEIAAWACMLISGLWIDVTCMFILKWA
jgi:hypothetical protein